eukprot:12894886-Alexandrium_andersonii.AAC.1
MNHPLRGPLNKPPCPPTYRIQSRISSPTERRWNDARRSEMEVDPMVQGCPAENKWRAQSHPSLLASPVLKV